MRPVCFIFIFFALSGRAAVPDIRQLSILATNDIHGGVEPSLDEAGRPLGGFALWSGVVQAIRSGVRAKNPGKADVILLDAGDQFQGTLISNYNEGQLVFAGLQAMGYDAVISGNHGFDFGPIGWLVDQANDPNQRRQALERLKSQVSFPFLGANVYYRNSFFNHDGQPLEVQSKFCDLVNDSDEEVDWKRVQRPNLVQPYLLLNRAGVRVAVIGIENPSTGEMTVPGNVDDLCFDDEYDAYIRVRQALQNQADIFVLVIHDGNDTHQNQLLKLLKRLAPEKGPALVDAVISGHTHAIYADIKNNVPYVQSGFEGTRFGRIDLFWDAVNRRLLPERTKVIGGIRIMNESCDERANGFCVPKRDGVSYEGVEVVKDSKIAGALAKGRELIANLANRTLGNDLKAVMPDRFQESALADAMADALRATAKSDLAMMNTGGLQAFLPNRVFTYEDLFRVLPFNNHQVVVNPMTSNQIVSVIQKSIRSCGSADVLIPSGLKVTFQRNCASDGAKLEGFDVDAKLLHVETLAGEVLFDANLKPGTIKNAVSYSVSTLDFVAAGGSGFTEFVGIARLTDPEIFREKLTEQFLKKPAVFMGETDGRWRNLGTGP